jgi:hypothetical protein
MTANKDGGDDDPPSYVWWLMPAEPLKTKLQSLIDRLADQNAGSISFEPHITVSRSSPMIDPTIDELKAWIEEQKKNKNRPSCHIYIPKSRFRVATGYTFTQSVLLAINMEEDDHGAVDAGLGLADLRRRLVGGGMGDDDDVVPTTDDWFPHLSLLYSCDDEERRCIAQGIDLGEWLYDDDDDDDDDDEPLLWCFDAIQCMQIYLPVLAPRDVQRWSMVTKLSLG